ncbi:MAG: DUF1700 domain-containing protein [Lachnospiraceae bacterium]|jgi:uncharacterized membrane protein|nr:DUF1700 domain-containing protein [Lachnospiraceae bacterium]
MNRYEFISALRMALTGKVPATTVEDNIRYYEEYIEIQLRQGKSEEDVLEGLGDPRLLAKTIIEANKYAEGSETYGEDGYGEIPAGGSGKSFKQWYRERPHWLHTLMSVLMAAFVLFVVFTVLQALFPFILLIVLVTGVYRLIRQLR